MDLGIRGKVAVVTACSSGLGKAVAQALAAEGVRLVLFARSADLLRTAAAEIEKQHTVPVLAVPGDMRSPADVERLVTEMQQKFGSPDILVLNTGRPPHPLREVLEETDEARWEDAYRTQLWGAVLVARRIVPLIVERGWGRVIAITSASVKQPMVHHGLSTVFRAGVTAYMKHLANEIAAKGVTVNTVGPGSIDTPTPRTSAQMAERLRRVP
ncbi:MAG: SDR family NAD(P)-dependent oxidoreductase, partial [Betaproteobacteria bacterium]|nr:SDR family NAD(P)-dependent oxidoreductase [Betaproteobacteria bacterium]